MIMMKVKEASLLCRHARINSLPNCQLADEELSEYKKHSIGSAPKSSFGSRLKYTLEKHRMLQRVLLVLALIGACMVISDGVLTPAISVPSQVGGLGLTLTKADCVIVVDPAWNPSTDNQSVDRAYRIGQNTDVVVYRLMSCGTVEEKIYRKQVSAGQRERLAMLVERLNQSGDRIKESKRTILETEELGVSILEDLHQQRQTLLHAHNKLHGVDDAIDKSKKVVSAMSRRMSRNKWIVASVIVALVIAIILILFFKLSHH